LQALDIEFIDNIFAQQARHLDIRKSLLIPSFYHYKGNLRIKNRIKFAAEIAFFDLWEFAQ
jgi:hypothetical protein